MKAIKCWAIAKGGLKCAMAALEDPFPKKNRALSVSSAGLVFSSDEHSHHRWPLCPSKSSSHILPPLIRGRVIVDRVVYARRKAEVILFLFGDSSLRTNQLVAGGGCAENQTIIHNLQQQIIQSYPLSR
ncbi:hypothetical protein DdX_07300 [Ditylenchus destructor]|uniref:Uncharacterized protein n=1 Tax=Ditylenchus destructor TaxID=166010 RepID=A0AAD4N7C3_9BILA|nr:hypothetical protein DdX_07300 [Ditylenchus destructor]